MKKSRKQLVRDRKMWNKIKRTNKWLTKKNKGYIVLPYIFKTHCETIMHYNSPTVTIPSNYGLSQFDDELE